MRLRSKCYVLFFFGMITHNLHAQNIKATVDQQRKLIDKNSDFSFVENKGQIKDEYNRVRTDIQYKIKTPGVNVFIGNAQLHYQFNKVSTEDKAHVDAYRMDVVLVGANNNAKIISEDKQDYAERYCNDAEAIKSAVAYSFKKITYQNVYPNIDWVLYIKKGTLEYDFIVRPGGDAKKIKIQYNGNTGLDMTTEDGIVAKTPFGTVSEQKPYTYVQSSGKELTSAFVVKNNFVSFTTADCNTTYVIDPQLSWATYYGGAPDPQGEAGTVVAVDATNNVYMAGYTYDANNIATVGAYQTVLNGITNAFLVKFNAAGVRQFATYFGGVGETQATGLAFDNGGYLYMCGTTNGYNGIFTTGGAQTTYGGGINSGFLVKFNNSGVPQWGTYIGGSTEEEANGIAYDNSGSIYVVGNSASPGIATQGAYQTNSLGKDGFIAKYSLSGSLRLITYYGGTGNDYFTGVACDKSGNVYAAGYTSSTSGIATLGAYQSTYGGGISNAFIVKFDSTVQTRAWGTYYGSTATNNAYGIAIDTTRNIYITGYTTSSTSIATPGSAQPTFGGSFDAFLAKFNNSGALLWGTYMGGSGNERGAGIAIDRYGNATITGQTNSSTNIATIGTGVYQTTFGGANDCFVEKYNTLGQRLYGTYYGGSSTDFGFALAYDTSNLLYLCGVTGSPSNITTSGSFQSVYPAGNGHAFLAKFNKDTLFSINQPFVDTLICAGGTFSVGYTTNYILNAGNVFSVYLSNSSGSFASPTLIGSAAGVGPNGSISVTIPPSTALGNGYRIRIVSSNPIYTSPDDYYNINIFSGVSTPLLTSNSPVCVGDSIRLLAANTSSITPVTFNISGPNGFSSSASVSYVPFATGANAGSYTATVIHNGCPAATTSVTVVVNSIIPPTPSANSNSPICSGSAINIHASSIVSPVTYRITGPNGYVSFLQNPIIANADTSRAGYYFIVDTLNGCRSAKDSILVNVTQSIATTVNVVASPGDTVCSGNNFSFVANTTNAGNNPQYQWRIHDVVLGDTAVVGAISNVYGSQFLTSGDIVYCILYSNAQCLLNPIDTSNKVKITILQPSTPVVSIAVSPSNTVAQGTALTFTSTVVLGGANTSYQWYVNGHAVANDTLGTATFHSLADSDVVTLIVHNHVMCANPDSAISNAIRVHITTGISNVEAALNTINLYPNPNNGVMSLTGHLEGLTPNSVQLEILNVIGQLVYTNTIGINNGTLNGAVKIGSNIAEGTYLLRIKADGESRVIRFTVQK